MSGKEAFILVSGGRKSCLKAVHQSNHHAPLLDDGKEVSEVGFDQRWWNIHARQQWMRRHRMQRWKTG